ncbi:hypothetical protein [Actinotalea sp. C106]|uniref:hypothetical protein n=1 Tax=Actinotalea sp. C106 TaxID=2908644 RepID=UPI0020291715|nr:hypothetical protein [Actinotalea sp. C106]
MTYHSPASRRRRAQRRRRTLVRATLGTAVFGGLVALAGLGVSAGLTALTGEAQEPVRCAAASDGTSWYLDADQAETAALLTATSVHRDLPARAATIAIATGLQESKLRNIDYGDRDSVGIFQQRPSQGWGTVEQIMDPVYSTGAFYDGLVTVDGYQEMAVTEAAQAVQRSGFPDAYAQHEVRSRAWASALTGYSPAALTCTLAEPEAAGDPDVLAARVERDYAGLLTTSTEAQTLSITVAGSALEAAVDETGAERLGWGVAQWSVALADAHQVTEVSYGDQTWSREAAQWQTSEEPVPPGQVRVALAG